MGTRAWVTHPRVVACLGIGVAAVLGYLAADVGKTHLSLGLAACAFPLVPLLLLRPMIGAAAGIAFLPFEMNVIGGSAFGLNIAPSDVLLSLAFAGVLLEAVRSHQLRTRFVALRPLIVPFGVYLVAALVVIAAHPSTRGVVRLVQRCEVVGIAAILGGCLLTERIARRAFLIFVVAGVVLTLLWLVHGGRPAIWAGQKNPSGQFIADAALVTLALVRSRWRIPLALLLVAGVYATESRGALIGLGAGVAVLILMSSRDPVQVIVRGLLVVIVFLGIFQVLPKAERDRLSGETSSVRYSDHVRSIYARDARRVIDEHPILGVGIGNYLEGDPAVLTLTDDPHDVVLLEAAEGGMVLLTGFIVLHLGAAFTVIRRRRRSTWAPLALAVEVAVISHSVVDVYWVRGTPVAPWVLIGLALAAAHRAETTPAVPAGDPAGVIA
ncbi:O-antigen ligase family protein [Jatrophihabitans sp.]|uniref:O-antigen ligase family protein n=1 Tax=Jatrophihabitans sp. TaxID=1932789 RepID=UPI0030C778E7|nr:hypothetical protein [Jatrophihabitans sp.]